MSLCIVACAPHGDPPPAPSAAAPSDPEVDEQLAISIAKATLGSCTSHSFAAELKRWDGEDWWNVSCRHRTTPTSIEYESRWIRKSDGRQHYGASWTDSTQPEWVSELMRLPEKAAIEEAERIIGTDHDIDCFGSRLLHDFTLFCHDRETPDMWHVSVNTGTGEVRVRPSPFQAMLAEARGLDEPSE